MYTDDLYVNIISNKLSNIGMTLKSKEAHLFIKKNCQTLIFVHFEFNKICTLTAFSISEGTRLCKKMEQSTHEYADMQIIHEHSNDG